MPLIIPTNALTHRTIVNGVDVDIIAKMKATNPKKMLRHPTIVIPVVGFSTTALTSIFLPSNLFDP